MKKVQILAVLLVLLPVLAGGCAQPPPAVKAALYTAQLSLEATAQEAAAGEKGIWKVPDDATVEEKLAIRERQVVECVKTMEQASKNLKVVVSWFRQDHSGLSTNDSSFNSSGGGR